ncbi:deoxyribodipyrimidine photo-lyase [Ravibacter arvi]|uniref:Deoxyribodipyrimidine photo-lyase n=1 Tax=Ravibacter arvi TaxID=2051041 RepID=A0ABP8M8Y6_9BACT
MKSEVSIFWFRRDLRIQDNRGLHAALASGYPVLPVFVFDRELTRGTDGPFDRRVDYVHQVIKCLDARLREHGSGIFAEPGTPVAVFQKLCEKYDIKAVFCNREYEPTAIARDEMVRKWAVEKGIAFHDEKDHVIFERDEVMSQGNTPYSVFSAYARTWKSRLSQADYQELRSPVDRFFGFVPPPVPSLRDIGFEKTGISLQPLEPEPGRIANYAQCRDYPAVDGTSRLSVALRFGTVSVRRCVAVAIRYSETWLNELIWREFFMQVLYHFPRVERECFKPAYESIRWRNNEAEFEQWCEGRTGYALVDAGMAELNETGYMHNRVRMVTASFLTKHLLIDWRWGEAYFAQKLTDYERSSNVGNWQWVAGCGCDAAPYFRVFNPAEQMKKFDRELMYVRRWNPGFEIKKPMVDHEFARKRALEVYRAGVQWYKSPV